METSKAKELEAEGIRLWLYSRKTKSSQIARQNQVSVKIKYFQVMEHSLIKRKGKKRAL